MNDLADWRYDAHVERTRNRPLATGSVSRREAWILASALTLASFDWFCRSTGSRCFCHSRRSALRRPIP